jgi:hypothetical protein
MKPMPEGIVNHFANFHPAKDDIKNVVALVDQLQKQPSLGIPIPFDDPKYQGCMVAFTADGNWRLVYRPSSSEGIIIVSIDPQEREAP